MRKRFTLDKQNGKLMGVCAGIARMTVTATIATTVPTITIGTALPRSPRLPCVTALVRTSDAPTRWR